MLEKRSEEHLIRGNCKYEAAARCTKDNGIVTEIIPNSTIDKKSSRDLLGCQRSFAAGPIDMLGS